MADRVRTAVIVVLLAMAIWLFAEADSLGTDSGIAEIKFVSSPTGTPKIRIQDAQWDGRVTIEVRGSNTAIRRFRGIIGDEMQFAPGDRGMPPGRGDLKVDLLEAIEAYVGVREARVQLLSVVPSSVRVVVEDLVDREVPVRVRVAEDISLAGSPVVTPAAVTLTGSQGALSTHLAEDAAVIVDLTADQLDRDLPTGVARTLNVPVTLPDDWVASGISCSAKSVGVELTLRSTIQTISRPEVPVQVVLPSIELQNWDVAIKEEDRLIGVTLTGPAALLEPWQGDGAPALLAMLLLSSDELEKGITSKPVTIFVRDEEGGVLVPLPESVTASPSVPSVGFTAVKRSPTDE